jgi:protocatechuate 3,4-dioxygenase beta subunit
MEHLHPTRRARREFLRLCLAMPATFVLAACAGQAASNATPAPAAAAQPTSPPPTAAPPAPTQTLPTQSAPTQATQAQTRPATPACDDNDDPTLEQTEGPFYTPKTPERTSLIEPGVSGTKLVVTGFVLTTACKPVAGALLDFWQADDKGEYDNAGYKLRGHQFADDQGRYSLETIVPGLYPGRTRHIHVKVQAPNQPILTSQLYFPGEARNQSDGIFQPELLMNVQDAADGKMATFDFVLDIK